MYGIGMPELIIIIILPLLGKTGWELLKLADQLRFGYRISAFYLMIIGPILILFSFFIFISINTYFIQLFIILFILLWIPVFIGIKTVYKLHQYKFENLNINAVDCIRWQSKNPKFSLSLKKIFPAFALYSIPFIFLIFIFSANLPPWTKPFILIAGCYFLAHEFWPLAKRRFLASADEATRSDKRPPVLLLRSFQDDLLQIEHPFFSTKIFKKRVFEEILTGQLWCEGPVIAIGRPGEPLPPKGAARSYFSDETWQVEAENMALESQAIVMIIGITEGLGWEIQRINKLNILRKLFLVFPPISRPKRQSRWDGFCSHITGTDKLKGLDKTSVDNLIFITFLEDDTIASITLDQYLDPFSYQLGMSVIVQLFPESIIAPSEEVIQE